MQAVTESTYPLSFRKKDAQTLGEHLRMRRNVELVGMKRVGISNFLRFFLYQKDIVNTYIDHNEQHLFIPVDLNDLIEREIRPFWILTFKRILDVTQDSTLPESSKKKISSLFTASIQSQDLFMTLENMRQAVSLIIAEKIMPTLFFIRFDRMEQAVTLEFFNNLQGFIESSHHKLAYVFTSFRPLDQIKPDVFTRHELMSFSHIQDLKPASHDDIAVIYNTLAERYPVCFTSKMSKTLLTLSGGHVQYLHLMLVILSEKLGKQKSNLSHDEIMQQVTRDERIKLQSEEIWESLSKDEKDALLKIYAKKPISVTPSYLLYTGIVDESGNVFSPLFAQFMQDVTKTEDQIEFTKKEHKLYSLLSQHLNEVCERDMIIHEVWPEYEEIGVSDWTIDRLVARLRSKLKKQNSTYSIVTVKTRGYKMV